MSRAIEPNSFNTTNILNFLFSWQIYGKTTVPKRPQIDCNIILISKIESICGTNKVPFWSLFAVVVVHYDCYL